jgi:hypothetical protein
MGTRKVVLRGLVGGAILGGVFRLLLNLFLQMHWGWEEIVIGAASGAILGILSGMARARREQRHAGEMVEFAQHAGFTHIHYPSRNDLAVLRAFPVFQEYDQARHRLVRADDGLEMIDLDLVNEGVQLTVVLFPRGAEGLPNFLLKPELLRRGIGRLGVTFETAHDAPDATVVRTFGKGYHLEPDTRALGTARKQTTMDSASVDALRRVFTLDVLRFFADNPGWSVEVCQGHLAMWRGLDFIPIDKRLDLLVDSLRAHDILTRPSAGVATMVPGRYRQLPYWFTTPTEEIAKGIVLGLSLGVLLWLILTCAVMALLAPGPWGAWFVLLTLIVCPLLLGIVGGRWSYRRCRAVLGEPNDSPREPGTCAP